MEKNVNHLKNELAPCGVYCGACPSFEKTCLGCASESDKQKRKSKFGCKIRSCCYNIERKEFCADCKKFPCKKIMEKLINSHPGDPKFKYRHEIQENFEKMKEMGILSYLVYQRQRWVCNECGERVNFYHYKCSKCGKEKNV